MAMMMHGIGARMFDGSIATFTLAPQAPQTTRKGLCLYRVRAPRAQVERTKRQVKGECVDER
eukprot:4213317-Pleurochrysis_carterae.AAC.1